MGSFCLMCGALMVAALLSSIWSWVVQHAWRQYIIQKKLREQGVRGPDRSFWSGCVREITQMKMAGRQMVMEIHSHDFLERVVPHYVKWASQYGRTFVYWVGQRPRLCISDPELVKQVLSNKFGFYPKVPAGPAFMSLLGKGLVLTEGAEWARHKRVVGPAFTTDKLKSMTTTMADCAKSMLDNWQGKTEVEASKHFQELTADVISHTAFGSSYATGKEVFLAQKQLQMIVMASILRVDFPFKKYFHFLSLLTLALSAVSGRYLPTETNLRRWKLEKKMRNTLMSIIEKRLVSKETTGYGNDLLGLMMDACMSGKQGETIMTMDEIVDECKTFFFAGHETTSHLLTWSMFLLSIYPEWQEKLREEVIGECGMETPEPDKLGKLKLVTMVLFESLRLYCPVVILLRTAYKEMKLGSLTVPKGVDLTIPIAVIHHSKEFWGADVNEFNPLRFENGISKAATHPNAMLAFSIGPRACVGQNFALLEAKIVLCMILQRFSFSLSPDYKHMPIDLIALQPQRGLPVILKPFHP
ncbi:Cytochrome P450 734A1 [Apostasia shenzhenica]|uniref:Cytochrome P450 734A1 n=1 Tax=Apostasia shenzhenica TaxID=1088818 RepID=A0A2I0AXK8_9ASPA|nr:Cytochrome P450 734A1 [Apostasia shenzhenica]